MVQYGSTLLMRACDDGRLDIVNVLIDNGADANEKDNVSYTLNNNILFDNRFMFGYVAGGNDFTHAGM